MGARLCTEGDQCRLGDVWVGGERTSEDIHRAKLHVCQMSCQGRGEIYVKRTLQVSAVMTQVNVDNPSNAGNVNCEPGPLGGACPDRRQVRYKVARFNHLKADIVHQLHSLTNDPEHGDFDDDGNFLGSDFSDRLTDLRCGRLSQHDCWVVIASDLSDPADSVLGWAMCERIESTPGRQEFSHGSVGLYVHPDHRGNGIARGLIDRATRLARDNSISLLMAYPWNKRGRSFFASVGFSTAMNDHTSNIVMRTIV